MEFEKGYGVDMGSGFGYGYGVRLWILEFRKSFRFRDFKSIRSKIRSSMFVEFGGKGER
jgi:hypothetical protein